MNNPSIEEVHKFLNPLYKNIDFRVAIYKEGEEWKYITSIFRFTDESKENILAIHKNLRKIPHKTDNFDIKFSVLNVEDWEKYWEKIKSKVSNIDTNFDSSKLIFNQNFRDNKSMHLSQEDWDFNSIQYNLYLSNSEAHHKNFKFLEENKEIRTIGDESVYPIIEKSLQIESYALNIPLFSLILFPIYIKFDNLQYLNNYLKGTLKYHEIFNKSVVFFDFIDNSGKSIGIRREYTLETSEKEFKEDNISKISFIQHFSNLDFSQFQTEPRMDIKVYFEDLNINLIHFTLYTSRITQEIKNIEKIPEGILNLVTPIIKLNLLNKEDFKSESEKFIESIKGNERSFIKIIVENLEWLLDFRTPTILKDFFFCAANQKHAGYYILFKKFIIIVCEECLINKIIDDSELKVRINDLLILNSVLHFQYYHVRLSTIASLVEIKDIIAYIFNRILRKHIQCMGQDFYDRTFLDQLRYEFPSISYECKFDFSNEVQISMFFIENNPKVFNYSNIYLIFYDPRVRLNIWEDLDQVTTEKIIEILNEIFKLSEVDVENIKNLPHSIQKALNNVPQVEIGLTAQGLEWVKEKKFIISKGRRWPFDFAFKDFNIFVGKNNSGKTYALSMIFQDLSKERTYNNINRAQTFQEKFPNFPLSEIYYIPNHRTLVESVGDTTDIYSELNLFFKTLVELQLDKYLKIEAASIEEQGNQNNANERFESWKIPDFINNLDVCALESGEEADLTPTDKLIIENGGALLSTFKRVFDSWKRQINKFFPDIQIQAIKKISRGRRRSVLIRDEFINHEITNWNWYGSGTTQLLNLVFLIEYLKLGPLINYESFLDEINMGSIENALKEYVRFERNNRIIIIDEPEISLHPSLQRAFFKYLHESSSLIQIFIATQSPFFLDITNLDSLLENEIMVRLFIKKENGEFDYISITKKNKILVIDEIFDYDIFDIAFFLSRENYRYLRFKEEDLNLSKLKMIKKMVNKRYEDSSNKQKLIELGTQHEDYNTRLLQNAHFLISQPIPIDLTNNEGKQEEWKQIFIYQINKSKYKFKGKKRLAGVSFSCWNGKKAAEEFILTYTTSQSEDLRKKILEKLQKNETKNKCKVIKKKSIMIFPENSIPYSLIKDLIEFAIKNKIIIIAGMEHLEYFKIQEFTQELSSIFPGKYHESINPQSLNISSDIEDSTYINQAIIINSNGHFSFQIKNVPVYSNRLEKQEKIPIILNPTFFKFKTSIGDIAIFVCKDFLVNYSVIDKWMDKNKTFLIAVPSFTELVNPFRNKFGEIIHSRDNRDKTFIFANIAEFGGSGIYNFNRERDYEPGGKKFFRAREEKFECFVKKNT